LAVRSKGTNIRGTLQSIERMRGVGACERVIANTHGELGDALRHGGILTSAWYPIAWHDAFLRAVEETFPEEPRVIRTLSADAVKSDFSTLFKLLRLVASPAFALTNATRVMSRYYDGGRITVVEARDGYIHYRFDAYEGFTPRIWEDVVGGMEGVLDMLDVSPRGEPADTWRQPLDVRGTRNESRDVIVVYRAQ
jgi:hypothetical protein